MFKVIFIIMCLTACCISGASKADDLPFLIQGERFINDESIEEINQVNMIRRILTMKGSRPVRAYSDNKEYIFKDQYAVNARMNDLIDANEYVQIPTKGRR